MAKALAQEKSIAERFKCLGEHVLLRRLDVDDMVTAGGIVKPEIARQRSNRGEVVCVGEGRMIEGAFAPFELTPGDKVRFSKYGGTEVDLDGEMLLLLHWKQIYLVEN